MLSWRDGSMQLLAGATMSVAASAVVVASLYGQAVFSAEPRQVGDPQELFAVPGIGNYLALSDAARRSTSSVLAGYTRGAVMLSYRGETRSSQVECVTENFFSILKTNPLFGELRLVPGQNSVVLAHHTWRSLGAQADAVGSPVLVNGTPKTVIGVADVGFGGVEVDGPDFWMSLADAPADCSFTGESLLESQGHWLRVIGRPVARRGSAEVAAELETLGSGVGRSMLSVAEFRADSRVKEKRVIAAALASTFAVYLIGVVNVGVSRLIRALQRQREVTIKVQLGATRGRLLAEGVKDALLFALAVAGLSVAAYPWMRLAFETWFEGTVQVARPVGALPIVAALAAIGAIGAFVPALLLSVKARGLVGEREGSGFTRLQARLRGAFLALQVALAVALCSMAGLFLGSMSSVRSSIGYEPAGVVVVTLRPAGLEAGGPGALQSLLDQLDSLPSVLATALTSTPVLGSGGSVAVAASTGPAQSDGGPTVINAVSERYFSLLHMQGVEGSLSFGAGGSAIVNDLLARRRWPGESAIGKCVAIGRSLCVPVVGVVQAARTVSLATTEATIYVPMAEVGAYGHLASPRALLISADPASVGAVLSFVGRLRSTNFAIQDAQPLEVLAGSQARLWSAGLRLFGALGFVALALASVGIHGVLSFAVRVRQRELGIRLALGASLGQIVTAAVGSTALWAGLGWAIGLSAAVITADVYRASFYSVSMPWGTAALAALAVLFGVAVSLVGPARLARRSDLTRLLHQE
jgi:hypothetical protein